jgi:hypothetical protein
MDTTAPLGAEAAAPAPSPFLPAADAAKLRRRILAKLAY